MNENGKTNFSEKEAFPDTLILEERAKIILNALCGCVDEKQDYIPYMVANLLSSPAIMAHSPWNSRYKSDLKRNRFNTEPQNALTLLIFLC